MRSPAAPATAAFVVCLGFLLFQSHPISHADERMLAPCEFEMVLPPDSWVTDIALSANGDVIVSGEVFNPEFPTTPDALRRTCGGPRGCFVDRYDGFLMVLSSEGTLKYSTFMGVDGDVSNMRVAPGPGGSIRGLVAAGGRQDTSPLCKGDQPVLFRLVPGETVFRDVVCIGEGHPADLAVAADGSIWIAGNAYEGLQTTHALQPVCGGSTDLFLAHYASGTMRPLMVTCIGGRGSDSASGMALAPDGDLVVVGTTQSPDFPLVRPIQRTIGSVGGEFGYPYDAVIVRLDVTGRWLEYSTFLGGQRWDSASDVAVDASGTAFVVGRTNSSDFPVTSGPSSLDVSDQASDAFLVSLDRFGRMRASVLLGGAGYDYAGLVLARPDGSVMIFGGSNSLGFGVAEPWGMAPGGFLALAHPLSRAIRYSALPATDPPLGGVQAVTSDAGHVYFAAPGGGWTFSPAGWIFNDRRVRIRKWHLPPDLTGTDSGRTCEWSAGVR